jgi:hypothetical protein
MGQPIRLVIASFAVLSLAACSTPPVVLEQANHTAGLVAQLELELKEFNRVQDMAAQARLRSIEQQESTLALVAGQGQIADAARTANSDLGPAKLQARLAAVATATAQADLGTISAAKRLDAELASLLKPLPSSTDKLDATQKAIAKMAVELNAAERIAETKAFVKAVKESVDANKKKIEEAQAAASKAEKGTP